MKIKQLPKHISHHGFGLGYGTQMFITGDGLHHHKGGMPVLFKKGNGLGFSVGAGYFRYPLSMIKI